MTSDFYKDLFTAQPDLSPEGILARVSVRVMEVMNESLEAQFTA
jgi:hypothetical protein